MTHRPGRSRRTSGLPDTRRVQVSGRFAPFAAAGMEHVQARPYSRTVRPAVARDVQFWCSDNTFPSGSVNQATRVPSYAVQASSASCSIPG